MYDTRTVHNSIRYLYRGAIHEHACAQETVSALLRKVDCQALAAVFREAAHRVYTFETRGRHPLSLTASWRSSPRSRDRQQSPEKGSQPGKNRNADSQRHNGRGGFTEDEHF